jgi:hypothetical protein
MSSVPLHLNFHTQVIESHKQRNGIAMPAIPLYAGRIEDAAPDSGFSSENISRLERQF